MSFFDANTRTQFIRYGLVGLGSNLALYLLYATLTAWGVEHKLAMTLLYVVGVLQTFIFNKRWSFSHSGSHRASLTRYLAAYGLCYFLNLGALLLFVDRMGLPHLWVQGVAIIVLAILLFLMQKFWVFRQQGSATSVEVI